MIYYRVSNLEKYQHYRDRRPPWVKLYQSALEDVEFTCLQDASKAHAMLLLLVASRYDNHVPGDPKWLQNALHATEPVDLDALISIGFIEPCRCDKCASGVLASRQQDAMPREQRREKREERSTKDLSRADAHDQPVVGSDTPRSVKPRAPTWVDRVCELWTRYKGGALAHAKAGRTLKGLIRDGLATEEELIAAWEKYLARHRADDFASVHNFAERYATYARGKVRSDRTLTAPNDAHTVQPSDTDPNMTEAYRQVLEMERAQGVES